jgi:hypothetical protein
VAAALPPTRRLGMLPAMTGRDVKRARKTLGEMWGLGRPVRASEFGRILRFHGRDPGRTVIDWENRKQAVSGPASLAIEMMLAGSEPPSLKYVFDEA